MNALENMRATYQARERALDALNRAYYTQDTQDARIRASEKVIETGAAYLSQYTAFKGARPFVPCNELEFMQGS